MSSSPTLLAAAEDKRFHEPSLLLPNMHSPSPSTLPPTRTAQHQFSHASCSPLVDTAFVPQPLRAVRARRTKSREAARRATEGDHRRTRVHPLSPLVTRSLTLSTHLYLQSVSGRWSLSLQQVAPPTNKVDDSSACPTSYPNQQR